MFNRIRNPNPFPRIAILTLLAAAVGLAGALLPGLSTTPALHPPPVAASPGHVSVAGGSGGLSITSTPASGDSYASGETITVQVQFTNCITQGSGESLTIAFGSGTVTASRTSSYPSPNVTFSHTVTDSNYDSDGFTIATDALAGTYHSPTQSGCSGVLPHAHTGFTLPNVLATAQASHKVNDHFVFIDYDTNDNGLIDITTEAQLVAIEADDNGDGIPLDLSYFTGDERTAYEAAFPDRRTFAPVNGCPATGCIGYELMNDLDFDTNDDGQVDNADDFPNPRPIGVQEALTGWTATFDGNGHTIANLRQDSPVAQSYAGLFGQVTGGVIRNVGLKDVDITSDHNDDQMGALIGSNSGASVQNCWSTGRVRSTNTVASGKRVGGLIGFSDQPVTSSWSSAAVTITNTGRNDTAAGGLVGYARGNIIASYATGAVSGGAAAASDVSHIGGLVGRQNDGSIIASYATGAVSSSSDNNAGGLLGRLQAGTVTASYSTGTVTAGSGANIGGLVGSSAGTINHSYWDVTTSEIADDSDDTSPEGRTTEQLQAPTYYTGIYRNWNVNVDGTAGVDDPWHFGSSSQYPVPQWGWSLQGVFDQYDGSLPPPRDYDRNNNGRIEVSTLAQLNSIRHDLNGSGADGLTGNTLHSYRMAFLGMTDGMGCPSTGCNGYELAADLDFADSVHTVGVGWVPIGTFAVPYTGSFYGNDHTISNLRIATTDVQRVGLFGQSNGDIDGVGLLDVDLDVSYTNAAIVVFAVGALAGVNSNATIRNSYATGTIDATAIPGTTNGPYYNAGGLVGHIVQGNIAASWADVDVDAQTTSSINWSDLAGGLVGRVSGTSANRSSVTASYAHGDVTTHRTPSGTGGLLGWMGAGTVTASYATGAVACAGCSGANIGGIAGRTSSANPTITVSYWDTATTGVTGGETTANLIETIGYTAGSIYADWNVNVDGQAGNDDPWDFGGALQYPILKHGYSRAAIALQRSLATYVDYDTDGDNLIEIRTLAQLDAMRYDAGGGSEDSGSNGDGDVLAANQDDYAAAFPLALPNMGCDPGCTGYELMAHLDFDTDGDGSTHTAGTADADDAYADAGGSGAGWAPIPEYRATFDGNGYTISNLYINRSTSCADWVGLFSGLRNATGIIRNVGLLEPYVAGTTGGGGTCVLYIGALLGQNDSGGLVASAYVIGGSVIGIKNDAQVGGLVGRNRAANSRITACYALGNLVNATQNSSKVGGLVGGNYVTASITASWAASTVTVAGGNSVAGGLVGTNEGPGTNAATVTAGVSDNFDQSAAIGDGVTSGGIAYDTAVLQSATGYTAGGPFANFNTNLDGQAGGDDPWEFVDSNSYPILKYGHTAPGARAAQLDPQDATLRAIVAPADVDRVRKTGTYAYTLEVDPPVQSVMLDDASFTETQAGASSAVTAVMPDPPSGTAPWAVGDTEIPLAAGETPTVATVTVTSTSGLSTRDYAVTIQRIFCPKAQLSGPADVVGEGGVAEFTVLVCGDTTAPVVVGWRAEGAAVGGASAASGADLSGRGLPSTGTVTVPAGNEQTAVISFPIADDETAEGSESFTVTLTSASGGTERYEDDESASATIALSDPALDLAAPDGTGAGGAADRSNAPLTPQSRLVLTEGDTHAYTIALSGNPGETVTVVIHSNHAQHHHHPAHGNLHGQ